MADSIRNHNDCGCCEGITVETPVEITNRPGLSAIAYRAGTHARFKASMIAGLSQADLVALQKLRTRDDDDFTIALLDAWAMVCDVLTFYAERIANESYLLTATERASIINLARLIGYELGPGVAASTNLAFRLETAPGSPEVVNITKGTKVQSIPGPDEKPQTFETAETIEARGEWNDLRPLLTSLSLPALGNRSLYLQGTSTGLKAGDGLLLIGDERLKHSDNNNWDFRLIESVTPDDVAGRTLVTWEKGLGVRKRNEEPVEPAKLNPRVFAMRRRAAIFGYNAPDWRLLPEVSKKSYLEGEPTAPEDLNEWPRFVTYTSDLPKPEDATIDLDAIYPKVTKDSWVVLSIPSDDEVYQVKDLKEASRTQFSLTAKTTRIKLDAKTDDKVLKQFEKAVRDTTVFAESEELAFAETPIKRPVGMRSIPLDRLITPLPPGRRVVVSGRRTRVRIAAKRNGNSAHLTSGTDSSITKEVGPLDELVLLSRPHYITFLQDRFERYRLMDASGFTGYVDSNQVEIDFVPARSDDKIVSETATIKITDTGDGGTISGLVFTAPLENVFDRTTVTINANVAAATHGETVADEVLGHGDAGQSYQRFMLRNSPLTYTSADTPSGGETTLEVWVNDLKWKEVPTLFGHGQRERIYITQADDEAITTVQFGDGITGARLPIGHENVRATYRKGIGLEGLVKAGQLSLLMTRALGVKSVVNPLASTGAQDPQTLSAARTNSPVTVLTLDRIVSQTDYEDFARAFSGMAKALATWTWNLHARGVLITVAGVDGAAVDETLRNNLISSILKYGDARVPVVVKSYRPVTFKINAAVKIDTNFAPEKVLAAIETVLRSRFAFSARAFGQPVTLSELMAAMQGVAGVVAVDINGLYRTGAEETASQLLAAEAPRAGDPSSVAAAELLTLDSAPLGLEIMA